MWLIGLIATGVGIVWVFDISPGTGFGFIILGLTGLRFLAAACPPAAQWSPEIKTAERVRWPFYSVLVPLYQEGRVLAGLIASLKALDYPSDRLEILLIIEEDDLATRSILGDLDPGGHFRQVIVAPLGPRTKPKALNVGLALARGELICIFDAEDRPHKNQLKAAAKAFDTHPDWIGLQAPLSYYNETRNWLTRQFSLEYAALFHVWNPFLSRLGLPFPLGGTSNHVRADRLRRAGGWDSYNVTEDADLSFRLALFPGKLGYISLGTQEEAPETFRAWNYQRARWLKGFMQTWSVHMRSAWAPGGGAGLLRCLTLQITLGIALISALCHGPILMGLLITVLGNLFGIWAIEIPGFFVAILGLGYSGSAAMSYVGAQRADLSQTTLLHILSMPLYWPLLSISLVKAVIESWTSPFHWNKTEHGITCLTPDT